MSFAQIRGWYRDQEKQKAKAKGNHKVRAAARPNPEIKFYDIQRILDAREEDNEDETSLGIDELGDSDDEESHADGETGGPASKVDWLDKPREVFPPSISLALEDSELDLDSLLLNDEAGPDSQASVGSNISSKRRQMRTIWVMMRSGRCLSSL
ncbi:hypothetical protein R3P38DRAFT_3376596 [Favolaschia claudopus]|uniref:Uncharacterized protein n=1 Tax=Favolaschia claudopus TaxID=2862362 RepID=A0AAV9ZFC1_9AGAR